MLDAGLVRVRRLVRHRCPQPLGAVEREKKKAEGNAERRLGLSPDRQSEDRMRPGQEIRSASKVSEQRAADGSIALASGKRPHFDSVEPGDCWLELRWQHWTRLDQT